LVTKAFQLEASFQSVMVGARIPEAAGTRFKVKAHFKMKCNLRRLFVVTR
jgi:hypothetical protein